MIDSIEKMSRVNGSIFNFSILIPSWNNIGILKFCIKSIRKNSQLPMQIIVIINEGKDGTLDWVKEQKDIDYIYSPNNIGICYALNACRSLIKSEFILYLNDDMYVLPDWDVELNKEIDKLTSKSFMLSATMIEPINTGNASVIVKDFGNTIDNFRESEILAEYKNLSIDNWSGSTWPPNVVHIDMWDLVGGMSIEFSPGMYSDPDLSRKLYEAGVRNFKGVGTSLVYHFGSKSTKRVRKNKGRNMFLLKWGLTAKAFTTNFLNISRPYAGIVPEVTLSKTERFKGKIKRILSC